MSEKLLNVGIKEKPEPKKWFVLSFQHVFAMFGSTILVPILTGMSPAVALFASGVGTIIYQVCTRFSVPVYLGSSFAYISAVIFAKKALGGDISAAQTGLILVGVVYVVIAFIVHFTGKEWINKLLPPIVIGPMIAVIGLGLASTAISQTGLTADAASTPDNWKNILVAFVTFATAAGISTKAKGFLKIVPLILAVIVGYITAIVLGIVDFTAVIESVTTPFSLPSFSLPFKLLNFDTYNFYFGPEVWAILPLAFVTIAEHIGDHTVLSQICDKDFLKEPGLDRTLTGDGIATIFSAFIGGPVNTTYGENTGVVGLTKVASVYVITGAAIIAIILSCFTPLTALIQSIPSAVLGGMSILLFGTIASNGLRVLVDAKVDFNKQRNLIIAATMLVIGLGGAAVQISSVVSITGMALAGIVGIVLNLVLPKK